jgi:predicted helicase
LLEHFRGQPTKLRHKYREELHANEVAILPYYVANLNIEATYAGLTGEYEEFPNLCFVDTLDNVGLHTAVPGTQANLFGSVTEENVARIRRQNNRRISVIIGNPPYNANQLNENENNKNRQYPEVDKRIKDTYIDAGSAQKTKLYDMYARFLRWASDRISQNGIIVFVSNSSFVDRHTFAGFRKIVAQEFAEISIIDLKGNARTSGARRKAEGGNVFGNQIRVGVAVYFLVRKEGARGCRIFYEAVRDFAKADEKLEFLSAQRFAERKWGEIQPDSSGNWINRADNDFDTLMPLATRKAKAAKRPSQQKAIFKLFSLGVSTNRDEWILAFDSNSLSSRVKYLISQYDYARGMTNPFDATIKWSRNLKRRFEQGRSEPFESSRIRTAYYRPFCRRGCTTPNCSLMNVVRRIGCFLQTRQT